MCLHIKWLTVSLLSFERHWLTTTWWFRDFQSQTWWWALYNKNHLAYHMQLSLDDRRHLIAVKQWLKPKETWDIILVDKLGYWTAWNDHQANLTDYKLAVKWDFYAKQNHAKICPCLSSMVTCSHTVQEAFQISRLLNVAKCSTVFADQLYSV